MEETRTVENKWDLSTYRFKIEGTGLMLLVDALKEGRYRGIVCSQCGTVYLPGPTFCRKCFVDINEPVDVSDEGTITTYAVELADIRGNPLVTPKITCMIKLDDCDSWIIGRLKEIDWVDVKVGMRVRTVWSEEKNGRLTDVDHFEVIG